MQITHQPERYALLRGPRASGASVHKLVAGKGSHSVALAWYNQGFFEFNPDLHDPGLGARLALPVQLAQCLVNPFRIQTFLAGFAGGVAVEAKERRGRVPEYEQSGV